MPSSSSPTTTFQKGEKVLCFHGPMMYEGVVQDVMANPSLSSSSTGPKYFMHYNGWSKNWDEWVQESRVLKFNDSNLARQKELRKNSSRMAKTTAGGSNKYSKGPGKRGSASENIGSSKKRRGKSSSNDETVDSEEDYYARSEVKIIIPDSLKHVLIDDWTAIAKNKKLVKLPQSPTVKEILDKYVDQVSSTAKNAKGIARETAAGLIVYFDQALDTLLLYGFERRQYEDLIEGKDGVEKADLQMSTTYGAQHLLRLFDETMMTHLVKALQDVLKYMQKHEKVLFPKNVYEEVSEEYRESAS